MKRIAILAVALGGAGGAPAQDTAVAPAAAGPAGARAGQAAVAETVADAARAMAPIDAAEVSLEALVWLKRPLVVFADSPNDPAFQIQLDNLAEDPAELARRDVIVLTDSDPSHPSEAREKLRPRGFSIVLLDKDGAVKLRKPLPWSVREIIHAIDKFPLRQQEIREKQDAAAARDR
ncbi:DUF4174 domain-containing protein [Albidovulum sp.]|uniref:DUF4174 domain-containing protein n=1 Tax=Albidovulum sp. TaxID=1872424 RepID=UPI001E03DA77|nr:DUF4174 domain-containing protein [Paracoccaceae bacterium]